MPDRGINQPSETRRGWVRSLIRLAVIAVVIIGLIVAVRVTGTAKYISLDGLNQLRDWIDGFGILAPLAFMGIFILATVAFLPGLPLGLLGGAIFGAVWGTLWTLIAATIGATLAFLVGRYAARDMVSSLMQKNENLKKLDEGIEKHGWRMLMITRLVPVFPFNAQNYVYGLTRVKFSTYVIFTAIFMIPGTAVFTFAGGSLAAAEENLTRTFLFLGIAAVLFVFISLIPRWIGKRYSSEVTGTEPKGESEDKWYSRGRPDDRG